MTLHVLLNTPRAAESDRPPLGQSVDGHTADGALVEALRHNEIWAIEALHRSLTPSLVAIAMRYTGCRAAADDIVQETWLGVLQGIARFEGRCRLQTWIIRIVHFRSRTYCARAKRTVALSDLGMVADGDFAAPDRTQVLADLPALAHPCASPEDNALTGELTAMITAGLTRLPAAQRAVFILSDIHGCSAEEVCQRLRLSAGNRRVLLHRARRSLRRALRAYCSGEELHPEGHQLTARSDV